MGYTGSWVWDVPSGRPVYWSAEMHRIHGRDPAEGPPSVDEYRLLHPAESWSRWMAEVQRSVQGQTEIDFECSIDVAGGSVKKVRIFGRPILGAPNQVTEIIGWTTESSGQAEEVFMESGASEDSVHQVIDLIPTLVWSSRPDGSVNFFNRVWLDYTGLTAEQALDWQWKDIFHPDDVSTVSSYWQTLLASEQPGEIEARLRRFDGQYRWFLFRVKPVRDRFGRVIKWYGINTDIEDRKRAEDALRASERSFRLIVDTIPALVCTMTPAGAVEMVNQQVLDYFGKSGEEMRNWSSMGAVHQDDLENVIAKWRYSTENGFPYDIEHRVRRADGVYRWFHVRGLPLRDLNGNIIRWYVLLADVDDHKRAEQALREKEAHLRGVLETIPALVSQSASDGRLEYVNERALEYFGENLERAGFGVIHPDDREDHLQRWLSCLKSGQPFENTYRLRRADGAYRWFYVRVEAVRDQEGRVANWYTVSLDINDRRELEDALRSTYRRLSAALQIATIAELSASIAHEINQPLASVVANGHACLTWLSSDPPNLSRARVTAERIIRDGNAASETVERIRALFKQAPPAMALADINEIIVEVLNLIVDEARATGISVEKDFASDLPMIVVDRVQIQQTLINLAHNAIEAMEGITDRPKILSFTSRREGGDLLIQVRDSGRGMANSTSIFDPFVTTKPNGMGMGLSICRSTVEAHGGRLWANANEGAGTTFSFTLPIHPRKPA